MTISEGASFVHGGGNNIRGKRGLRETMTADAITLVYPPDYARYLIDVTVSLLKLIQHDMAKMGMITVPWPELDLSHFVATVFRHSKVSYSVLLTGLLYLLRFRHAFSTPQGCVHPVCAINTVVIVFVTSLVLSNKFLHDRHVSNATWAAHTGIPAIEINRGEIFFLNVINHQLNVEQAAFHKWMSILFHPAKLNPYQIIPPDNQVPTKQPWTGGVEKSDLAYYGGGKQQDPSIESSFRRRPEQTFMGYFPTGSV